MKDNQVNLSTMFLIAGTRVALVIGIGLLAANLLASKSRQGVGRLEFQGSESRGVKHRGRHGAVPARYAPA